MGEVEIIEKDIPGLLGEKVTVCALQLKSPFDDECKVQYVGGFNILAWDPDEYQRRKKCILSKLEGKWGII